MARFISSRKSKFMGRLGFRVLPSGFTVLDDPRLDRLDERPLMGHWKIDDEGVPSGETLLVEDGRLKSLLVTRTPLKKVREPNGHARTGSRGEKSPALGNLLVTCEEPVPEALKKYQYDVERPALDGIVDQIGSSRR